MSTIGSQFINKLIQDTVSGVWNNGWSVNYSADNNNTYTFIAPKQILTKANFKLDVDKKGKQLNSGTFVFPNGYGIFFDNLIELRDAVLKSLETTVVSNMKEYDGEIVEEDKSVEPKTQNTIK